MLIVYVWSHDSLTWNYLCVISRADAGLDWTERGGLHTLLRTEVKVADILCYRIEVIAYFKTHAIVRI